MNVILRDPIHLIRNKRGVTLVELMIAVAILATASLGMIGAFAGIQRATQVSKNKSLAANLAQEKMQILGQLNYYEVLVTPNPNYYVAYSSSLAYDPTYFPPESILEGGVNFTRLTNVQVVQENSGVIQVLPPATPDTGLRLVTVDVLWNQGSELKLLETNSIMANPNTVMSNSIFTGLMTDSVSHVGINGGLVNIAENMGWRDTTDSAGRYNINASPGSFTMVASAPGYFTQFVPISITANQTVTEPFSMGAMSSGTVTGTAWMNTGLVISQVVASTVQFSENNFAAQYIELYNPTPNVVTISGGLAPSVKVNFQSASGCGDASTCTDPTYGIKLNYVRNSVAAYGYYIIANTGTFTVNGVNMTADAVYADNANTFCTTQPATWNTGSNPPVKAIFSQLGHGGDVWLTDALGNMIDQTGWAHNANMQANCSPYCIPFTGGLAAGMEIVRTSSPNFASNAWGRAYDTGISSIDFVYPPIISGFPYQPFSSLNPIQTPIAGVPIVGGVISANDGLSSPVSAYSVGYPPRADFVLTSVATTSASAPWTVLITSGNYTLEDDTVTIPTGGSVYTYPSSTTILNQATTTGFISGVVTSVLGTPISPGIVVSPGASGGNATASTVNGRYLLRVTPGSVDVVANVSNTNVSYVSVSSLSVSVALGKISDGVNFTLSQGGRLTGFVTRDGVNALPGVAISAIDGNGAARDTEITDASGRFTTIDIATGTYDMTPELDSLETSSPTDVAATVGSGQTVFAGTFTITGALGTVSGSVTAGGNAITTGVLVIITTSTLSGSPPAPPALSSATLASNSLYITSSHEDGTWSVGVRQSTTTLYHAYGYYTTLNSTGAITFQSQTLSNISVVAGSTASGNNFAW